jgi:uroporphyrinogen decarboxylase
MTSRERVLSAICHKEPDRIPVDLGSTPSSGISAIAYNRLKRCLGMTAGHTRIYDVVQQLAQPEDLILDRFSVDVIDIGRTFNVREEDWYDIFLADGSRGQYPLWFRPRPELDGGSTVFDSDGVLIARMPEGGTFFDQTCYPFLDGYPSDYTRLPEAMGKVLWAALAHSPWDHANDHDFWATLRRQAELLKARSDRALMVVCGCNLFEWGTFLRRMDNFLMDLVVAPNKVEGLLDALLEVHLATLEKVCHTLGDVVDIVRFGDDLGMDQSPFMRPETQPNAHVPSQLRLYLRSYSRLNRGRFRDIESCTD